MDSFDLQPVRALSEREPYPSLASVFLAHACEDHRKRFAAVADLEAKLRRFVTSATGAWPGIRLPTEPFVAFLGRCLLPEAATDLDTLRAGDLYLVCAYGRGVHAAYEAVERRHMVRVNAALGRIGTSPALIADIMQELRRRLVEMKDPRSDRKHYQGRGDIGSWLCVSAVREANLQRTRRARELPLELTRDVLCASEGKDTEVTLFERVCEPELTLAFREAVASLCTRDRNLLRYSFIDCLSIDRIGLLYGVHRATAARWINRARETLYARTLDVLRQRFSLSDGSFNRMLGLLQSQLWTELATVDGALQPAQ